MIWLVFGLSLVNLALTQDVPENCPDGDKPCLDKIAAFLKKNGVIPDVIETPFKEKLKVNFVQSNTTADYGNELTPTDVFQEPEVSWTVETDSFYTISMTDPDAPSRENPIKRAWLHWLIGNVPGSSIGQGTNIAGYIGSAPPKGSGPHRYVLLVYKQPEQLTFDEKSIPSTSGEGRESFSISKFAEKYKLGDPVAGNFFQAQWDPTSEKIYKILSGPAMADALKKYGVIPDVIETAPNETMAVNYKESNVVVELGNELKPSQVKIAPEVTWNAEEGSFYVLVMNDPDAPSRKEPKFREWLHWLVVNVPGNSIDQGTTLAGYRGSGPPKGTGLHRYILLAYKQPEKLNFDEKVIPSDSTEGRASFSTSKFAKKYNLGDPVAGNFFEAQFEETGTEKPDAVSETSGAASRAYDNTPNTPRKRKPDDASASKPAQSNASRTLSMIQHGSSVCFIIMLLSVPIMNNLSRTLTSA